MQVVAVSSPNGSPTTTRDPFDFNSARISPYLSVPSSPTRFGECNYLSAPASPARFYGQFHHDDGFAFFVSQEPDNPSRSAEDLFDDGKIKPMKEDELLESVKSPLLTRPKISSPVAQGKPEKRRELGDEDLSGDRRGRNRSISSSSNSGRRVARSLSPYRISDYIWDEEHEQQQQQQQQGQSNKEESVPTITSSSSKSSRKWRLRDFLLFRSASEGRGSSKDPFRKFNVLYKKPEEPKPSTPARSSDIPRVRRKEPVSAHELHYARKKAESEDLKKKTFLPYKQGILGRLAGLGR